MEKENIMKRKLWVIIGVVIFLIVVTFGVYKFWGTQIIYVVKVVMGKEVKAKDSVIVNHTFKGLPASGNILFPAFSPNGQMLAFVRTRPEKSKQAERLEKAGGYSERIDIGVYNIKGKKSTIFISFNNVDYYAIYASFVSSLTWLNDRKLHINIDDGDVGYTDIVFDIKTRKLIKEKYIGDDTDEGIQLTPESQKILDEAKQLFPDLTNWDLMQINFKQQTLIIPRVGVLLHKNFSGEEQGIWLLDIDNQEAQKLLELPDEVNYSFEQGPILGDSAIFGLYANHKMELFLYQNGLIQKAAEIAALTDTPCLDTKYQGLDRVIFFVYNSNYYKNSSGYLYQWDQNGLTLINKGLEDVAVDPTGKRMAVCYLIRGKRQIKMIGVN
jgi:hypothetical protein